jgi:hypothetical protein
MKKIILICITFIFGIGNTFAQPAKGMPALDKTGSRLFFDSRNSGFRTFNPLGQGDKNFPVMTTTVAEHLMPNTVLSQKLTKLRDIFQASYPNSQGHSIIYRIRANKDKFFDNPRVLQFSMDPHGPENDGKGGLEPLNAEKSQGDTKFTGSPPSYAGLLWVGINNIATEDGEAFFEKYTQYDAILKTKKIPNISGIYLRPPHDNFTEQNKTAYPKTHPPDKFIGNRADNYLVFRSVKFYNDPKYGLLEKHFDRIILTNYKTLPYKPLTRKEFIAVLQLFYQTELEDYKTKVEKNRALPPDMQTPLKRMEEKLKDKEYDRELFTKRLICSKLTDKKAVISEPSSEITGRK